MKIVCIDIDAGRFLGVIGVYRTSLLITSIFLAKKEARS
jgi:hypothetical protein